MRNRHLQLLWKHARKECAKRYTYLKTHGAIQPGECIVCGTKEKIHGHHWDYSLPAVVVWYCLHHHAALHANIRKGGYLAVYNLVKNCRKNYLVPSSDEVAALDQEIKVKKRISRMDTDKNVNFTSRVSHI